MQLKSAARTHSSAAFHNNSVVCFDALMVKSQEIGVPGVFVIVQEESSCSMAAHKFFF